MKSNQINILILLKNKNNETCTNPMVGMGLNKTGAAGQFAH